jgi:hypothetical protein
MCSDAAQNGVPSCASQLLMTDKMREWGVTPDFFVVSDMGSYYNVFAAHKYGANFSDALYGDLHAGLDILYLRGGSQCRGSGGRTPADVGCVQNAQDSAQSNLTWDALNVATNGTSSDRRFTLSDVEAKAGLVLRLRFELGEFDPTEGNPYAAPIPASVIDGPTHRAVARDATAASVILLKNNDGVLPLGRATTIAVIGPYGRPDNQPSLATVNPNPYVHAYAGSSGEMIDILAGVTEAAAGASDGGGGGGDGGGGVPMYARGCDTNQTLSDDPEFANAVRVAASVDVAVVALGLTARVEDASGVGLEAEMRDRKSLTLPQVQLDLLAAVRKRAKKVVLVIVAGSGVPFDEALADAVVLAPYGGAQAGAGLADVLYGVVAPTGRLPITVFDNLSQVKPMGDYDLTTQPGRTYLYYDPTSFGQPQFWFGFGLGYSAFSYTDLLLSAPNATAVLASVTVTNVGNVSSCEVSMHAQCMDVLFNPRPFICRTRPQPQFS